MNAYARGAPPVRNPTSREMAKTKTPKAESGKMKTPKPKPHPQLTRSLVKKVKPLEKKKEKKVKAK